MAVGKKSFFYREPSVTDNNLLFNNDSLILLTDDEEKAYTMIENNLEIEPLKLNYRPNGLVFNSIEIKNDKAVMQFLYNGNIIYFVQAKRQKEADVYKRQVFRWRRSA